jgi:hypothetical protein
MRRCCEKGEEYKKSPPNFYATSTLERQAGLLEKVRLFGVEWLPHLDPLRQLVGLP